MIKKTTKYNIVMLIDDEEIDNFISKKMITAYSFAEKVLAFRSVEKALAYLRSIPYSDNKEKLIPDYIFLDLNMPILNGFQFLDEFEKLPSELKSRIKIIILTASISPPDIEKSKKYNNVTGFLHKPLTEKHLQEL
jgi:CheY-like chemotaxis protein